VDLTRLRLRAADAALRRLEEALALPRHSPLERDGAVQRFEFSFEAFWKAARQWLAAHEGLDCASPRACLRALGRVGVLDPEETVAALAMADDRNLTVHTYNETTARAIFARLPAHAALMRAALERMAARLAADR